MPKPASRYSALKALRKEIHLHQYRNGWYFLTNTMIKNNKRCEDPEKCIRIPVTIEGVLKL